MHTTQDYQCRISILYKPRQYLFVVDWLSQQNHEENKDSKIPGMNINIDVVHTAMDFAECMSIQDIQQATLGDEHLQ